MRIYADHAATTKLDPSAYEAMKPYFMEEYGNASQLYSFARAPKKALRDARETIAACIGAKPEEIYFTSGGTESDNWAIKGATLFHEGSGIITSEIEHHAVLHACQTMEALHHPVIYLQVGQSGAVDPGCLERAMSDKIRLVTVMFANNEIGTIEPIRELAAIAHNHNALFHTDAVQAVGHIPINVEELGIDFLSASAHKFNGPKGIGFLFVRSDVEFKPYLDGGAQENGMRAGTENVAAIVGMARALSINVNEMEKRTNHLLNLENALLGNLRSFGLDFVRNGDVNHIPGNVSLSFRGAEGETILHRLDFMGICVSTGSACNSKATEVSHVIRAIHLPDDYAYGTIRISVGYENTEDEMANIAQAIKTILEK